MTEPEFSFEGDPPFGLDELLVEVVDCCHDLAAVRLEHVSESELLVALSELMSVELMLEGVQLRLAERIDTYLAGRPPANRPNLLSSTKKLSPPEPPTPPRAPTQAPTAGGPPP